MQWNIGTRYVLYWENTFILNESCAFFLVIRVLFPKQCKPSFYNVKFIKKRIINVVKTTTGSLLLIVATWYRADYLIVFFATYEAKVLKCAIHIVMSAALHDGFVLSLQTCVDWHTNECGFQHSNTPQLNETITITGTVCTWSNRFMWLDLCFSVFRNHHICVYLLPQTIGWDVRFSVGFDNQFVQLCSLFNWFAH